MINLSLGRPIYESYTLDPLCQAVEKAWKAGIVVVVAAGNDGRDLNLNPEGYGTIDAPGNDPYALTVGAMNTMETAPINDDIIASYSSKGPSFIDHVMKPDIVAPGNLVTSLRILRRPARRRQSIVLHALLVLPDQWIGDSFGTITSRSAAPAWPPASPAEPLRTCCRPRRNLLPTK